jgi:CheY-like chemotaxis protein
MRILCVDDDPLLCTILCDMLHELGHEVIGAESGSSALNRVTRSGMGLDLLITDIRMPGDVDGRDVGRIVRETRPDLPIIYFTGDKSIADPPEGDQLLRKPCTLGMLEKAIDHAIAANSGNRSAVSARPNSSLIGRSRPH